MTKKFIYLFVSIFLVLSVVAYAGNDEKKDKKKKVVETITLFDGKTFTSWRGYNRSTIPASWSIDGKALKVTSKKTGEGNVKSDRGDIIFDRLFKNFELTFEYKVSKGANSGVLYLIKEIPKEASYKSAPEYQVLDNENHPDAKKGKDKNRQAGSLYDMIPANPQNAKPFDQWNRGGITVVDGKVTHFQNGKKVVEYELWTPAWAELVSNSKFKDWPDFLNTGGDEHRGYIGLQDHGDDVWYKNIKIKVLAD